MTRTSEYFVLFILSLLDDILTLYYRFTTWAPITARRAWFLFCWDVLPVLRVHARALLIAAGGLILTIALLSYSTFLHLLSSIRIGWQFRAELISEYN